MLFGVAGYLMWTGGGALEYEPVIITTNTSIRTTPTATGATPTGEARTNEAAAGGETPTEEVGEEPVDDYYNVEMAANVLTRPDNMGGVRSMPYHTVAWTRPTITYHYPENNRHTPEYRAVVADAIAWAARTSGLNIVEAENAATADIHIHDKPGNGGRVQVKTKPDGTIIGADIWLGCCYVRTAYEEIAQVLGPLGDQADSRSIFSQTKTATTPTAFDEWVLRTLYTVGPGATYDQVVAALEETRP